MIHLFPEKKNLIQGTKCHDFQGTKINVAFLIPQIAISCQHYNLH